jgi:hypothetical protein
MTTEDPHDQIQTAAAEEQPAGEQTPARAELLGTTALTARVRCVCGKRQDVDREDWQWNGVADCSRCGRGILDHSLRVVSPEEARSMVEARRPTADELRTLRHIELSLRDFMTRYDSHPRWYWSPTTNRMAGEVGCLLAELDESRLGRGAPPVVAVARAAAGGHEQGELWHGEDDDAGEGKRGEGEEEDALDDEGYEDDDDDLEEGDE